MNLEFVEGGKKYKNICCLYMIIYRIDMINKIEKIMN